MDQGQRRRFVGSASRPSRGRAVSDRGVLERGRHRVVGRDTRDERSAESGRVSTADARRPSRASSRGAPSDAVELPRVVVSSPRRDDLGEQRVAGPGRCSRTRSRSRYEARSVVVSSSGRPVEPSPADGVRVPRASGDGRRKVDGSEAERSEHAVEVRPQLQRASPRQDGENGRRGEDACELVGVRSGRGVALRRS